MKRAVSSAVLWLGAFGLFGCARSTETQATPSVRVPSAPLAVSSAVPSAAISSTAAAAVPVQDLTVHRGKNCEIAIEALLESEVYRGSPSSQAKWDSYKQDPKYARFAQGIDHGAQYLSCTFRVRVNGVRFRYTHNSHEGPSGMNLKAEECAEAAEADTTAKDIASFTAECTDLRGGEYYGDFLKPED